MPEVTLLSRDLDLLRETSWWLSAFGCQVRTVREIEPLAAAWDLAPPALLIVDADHPDVQQAAAFRKLSGDGYVYTVAMFDAAGGRNSVGELLGAFDDVVGKPLNSGETIARLRAGLRFREFERRTAEQSAHDQATGLATQRGLLCAMERVADGAHEDAAGAFSLVLMGLDGFDVVTRSRGAVGRDLALRQAVEIIAKALPASGLAARLTDGDFAALLPRGSANDAEEFAARLRTLLAEVARVGDSSAPRLTATFCIAAWTAAGEEPRELLRSAVKTLRQAKYLGGDVTVRCGEFDQAFAAWQQKAITATGALTHVTACDVMTPFTAWWSQAAASAELQAAILSSGAAWIPFVDDQENYVGVLPREAFDQADFRSLRSRVETPLPAPEDLKFTELADLLTSGDDQLLVVLREGRPLGYITCEALSNLLDAVNADAYRSTGPVTEGSRYLIVAESAACA